jgi:acyl-coenzyme A synthetase/AMP-(fatty) acid ligase
VEFVAELPMTATGKIIRKELRARATAEANEKRERGAQG